jgi:hypothetical protein
LTNTTATLLNPSGKPDVIVGECLFPDIVDRMFTENICLKVYNTRQMLLPKIEITGFSIQEQFSDENTCHYKSSFLFGNGESRVSKVMNIAVPYVAMEEIERKEHTGVVSLYLSYSCDFVLMQENRDMLDGLLFGLFRLYDKAIRQYYPSWDTKYDLQSFI